MMLTLITVPSAAAYCHLSDARRTSLRPLPVRLPLLFYHDYACCFFFPRPPRLTDMMPFAHCRCRHACLFILPA